MSSAGAPPFALLEFARKLSSHPEAVQMKMAMLLAAMLASLSGVVPSEARVFRMDIHEGTIDVAGIITTDSTTGVLSGANIQSYALSAVAPGSSIDFSPITSLLFVLGNDLVSTGTELTFDYSAGDGEAFSIIAQPGRRRSCALGRKTG